MLWYYFWQWYLILYSNSSVSLNRRGVGNGSVVGNGCVIGDAVVGDGGVVGDADGWRFAGLLVERPVRPVAGTVEF